MANDMRPLGSRKLGGDDRSGFSFVGVNNPEQRRTVARNFNNNCNLIKRLRALARQTPRSGLCYASGAKSSGRPGII